VSTPPGSGADYDLRAVRQILVEGLALLGADTDRLRSLLELQTTLVLNRRDTAEAFEDEQLLVLRNLLRAGVVNFYADTPDHERQIPFVGISWTGEASETAPHVGGLIAEELVTIGGKSYRSSARGEYRRATAACSVLAPTIDETRVLYSAVWHVLEHDRGRLYDLGLYDLVTTGKAPETDQVDEDIVRLIEGRVTLTCTWMRRSVTLFGPSRTRVTVASALSGE